MTEAADVVPLRGGEVGIVVDTRGRPIVVPQSPSERVPKLDAWVRNLGEYPTNAESGGAS